MTKKNNAANSKRGKDILWFKDIDKDDADLVGSKGANLGEMVGFLGELVPNGFVITSSAYHRFIEYNSFAPKIKDILKATNVDQNTELDQASNQIQKMITSGDLPEDMVNKIIMSYNQLGDLLGLKLSLVAVRASPTGKNLSDSSFAGQQETFLNIKGEANLINYVRQTFASLFTPRAIFYREKRDFNHFEIGLAVIVQKMIQSEASGVMFTIDPVTNEKDKIVIEAVWGLGEYAVHGVVTPDHYKVLKAEKKIIEAKVYPQKYKLIHRQDNNIKTKVATEKQTIQKLNSSQIINLAEIGEKIHQHYFFPQDIEWAMADHQLYILETKQVTTMKKAKGQMLNAESNIQGELVLKGDPAGPGLSGGKVKLIKKNGDFSRLKKGDILVTDMTAPDLVTSMKRAAAIVTDFGGLTSHAAIISRELGIPCVVGTEKATKILNEGDDVVVNGETGEVWLGTLKNNKTQIKRNKNINKKPEKEIKTATKVYVNLAESEMAKTMAGRNVDGVGLLRAEFMIAKIGTHPQRLLQLNKGDEFVNQLAGEIKKFCQAFSPRPVVYRATDFKTSEYRRLKGGKDFEPEEPNPLLGFRGALRYISMPKVFELEIEAIKKVRNKHRLKNLWLMIPFVRTPGELVEVKRIAAAQGLTRSPSFKLWMMVEIPSNVILLDQFIKAGIDGVSIGSNDLTMLTLGLDRDNNDIAYQFDETNPAVLKSIKKVVKTCHKHNITSSICGQVVSENSDIVENLVKWGITSISVNPDAIDRTREIIKDAEKRRVNSK